MLTIESGKQHRFCDGISRRNFLQIGSLAMGGLSLPQVLRAQDLSGKRDSHKAVIMIFLSGGPPHQDWFDLKPEAPAEIRGPRVPIATNVPGLEVCELMPQLANMADKFSFIRSIVGAEGRHASFQCMTGRKTSRQPQGGWPSLGATVSKLQGGSDPAVPPFVGLSPKMRHYPWADAGQPGFLGVAHSPFKPSAEGKQDMILNAVNAERLDDRKSLLASLDNMRRQAEVIEDMQVHKTGIWYSDFEQTGSGAGPFKRRSEVARPLWSWLNKTGRLRRRRTFIERLFSDGPTPG